jgi:hypothetical protein
LSIENLFVLKTKRIEFLPPAGSKKGTKKD